MQGLENLRLRLKKACELADRNVSEVILLAVGKKHPASSIRKLHLEGQTAFGENVLQEARDKQLELTDLGIEWHFIGRVQSNKTRALAEHFDWVQSVDRLKVLDRLSRYRPKSAPELNICLQVNIDEEPQKSGLLPAQLEPIAEIAAKLPGINFRGLMAIPRASEDRESTRDSFRRVKALYDKLREEGYKLDTLSMGMSSDLEIAIAQGSTMVRVGTDLFGPRPNTGN